MNLLENLSQQGPFGFDYLTLLTERFHHGVQSTQNESYFQ